MTENQEKNGLPTRLSQAELLQKANALPLCPGVYLMKDRAGKVIYVGKSRKLKNRVSQYFQNGEKAVKTARMVSLVADFDYFICDTEIEALSLENTLIKQYTPKYNIRLKDAKSYPYIKVTAEEYPRIIMTRTRQADRGRYFGPYSGTATVFSIIDTLQRTLGLADCKHRFPRDIGRVRPCLYYQMGRCCGICTGNVSPEEYGERIDMAVDILRGKTAQVRRRTEEEMLRCAEEERYEAAAAHRDTLRALERLSDRQNVVAAPDAEQDIVGLYSDDICSCISVFYIRGGAVSDKSDFVFGRDQLTEASDMSAFLCEHYRVRTYVPHEILLSFSMEEEELQTLSAYLTDLAGHKVVVRTPERGHLRTLARMVEDNARERASKHKEALEKDDGALLRLAQLCGLEVYPERIEAYDISNLGSEHLTAGMIVCREGQFKRSDYRTFHIKGVTGTDDYASMREALSRRLSHLGDEDGSFATAPDLILLDGGRGHVGVIRQLLDEMGLDIPVFGMVKDDYHKTRALCSDTEEISIAREQQVFMLLYRIQEEVHRYTVSRMDAAKRKTLKTSSLQKIPGIGEAKAKALLTALGGLGAIKQASVEQLAAVKGIGKRDAQAVYAYFNGEGN
ncbi:MAG: excinuclease ABC subunit UvrC [Ruminococcaceae bacterium]|nr:excinuclease ABC subunit UvrC [Oscillospiraceae bacterium]